MTTRHDLSAELSLHDVGEMTADLGPTTTVYLPTPSDTNDAAQQMQIRWTNLKRDAKEAGASEADRDAFDSLLAQINQRSTSAHYGGSTLIAVMSEGTVVGAGFSERALTSGLVSVSPVPALLPLLANRSAVVDHLIVTIDRKGADVTLITPTQTSETTVEGDDEHIHRSKAGGWSQRRFQQRAENTWESNSKEVADHVTGIVRSADPELVIVAGDERAIGFLREHLPQTVNDIVTEVRGARVEWSERDIAERAATEVDSWVAEQKVARLREFADACGTGRAVQGATETLEVLRQGRAERLIIMDDTEDTERPTAWSGSDPSLIFLDPSASDGSLSEAPLADLAVRTASHLGTDIFVVPRHAATAPDDGLGAVLRG